MSYCDEHKREIRQISPKTKWSLISVTWNNWPGKVPWRPGGWNKLKDSKDPPWTQLVFHTYSLLYTTVTGGRSVSVIKEKTPLLERGRWGKTNAIKENKENTAIHLLTYVSVPASVCLSLALSPSVSTCIPFYPSLCILCINVQSMFSLHTFYLIITPYLYIIYELSLRLYRLISVRRQVIPGL